jgi:hypothetical protein
MDTHESLKEEMQRFLASSRNVRNPNSNMVSSAIFYTNTKLKHYLALFKIKISVAELREAHQDDYEQCCNASVLMLHSLLGPLSTSRNALQEMEGQFALKCLTTVKKIQKR